MTDQTLTAAAEPRLPAAAPGSIRDLLQTAQVRKRFEQVLGPRAGQFIANVASVVYRSPQLRQCDPSSIIAAALIAASLDLPIDPNLGYAAIVPYKAQAQFQMQWKGYVQLAHRTRQYAAIHVTEIYQGQIKSANPFTGALEFGERLGPQAAITGYMAYFRLTNGFEKYLYMTLAEIEAHGKRYSKSFDHPNGAWKTNREAMLRKTPIKLLLKTWGVLSVEMQQAIEAETPPDESLPASERPTGDDLADHEQRQAAHTALWGDDAPSASEQASSGGGGAPAGQRPAAPGAGQRPAAPEQREMPPEPAPQPEPPSPPALAPTPAPAIASLRGKVSAKFERLAAQHASTFPAYQHKNGHPDLNHILAAAAREGFPTITSENVDTLFDVLSSRALEARRAQEGPHGRQ